MSAVPEMICPLNFTQDPMSSSPSTGNGVGELVGKAVGATNGAGLGGSVS